MALDPFPLPIAFGKTDAVKGSGGHLINWMAEQAPADAKTPVNLLGTPGLRLFSQVGDNDILAGVEINNAFYVVSKGGFYRVFPDGGAFLLGTLELDPQCSIASNGLHVVVVDGKRSFAYTIQSDEQQRYDNQAAFVNFVTELTGTPNFYPSNTVTFLDQMFIFDRAGSSQFFNTGLLTLTVDPAAFTSAESKPDHVVAMRECQQQLFAIGNRTYEVFYNSGAGKSPFVRVQGAVGDYGTEAPYTVQSIRNTVLWLAHDRNVVQISGYAARVISTQAIADELMERDTTGALAWTYTEDGHDFYVLTVGDFTAAYDLTTGLWHQRKDARYGRHRGNCAIRAYDRVFVGSFDGKLYQMAQDIYAEESDPLIAQIVTGPLETAFRKVGFPRFEIDIDVGFDRPEVDAPPDVHYLLTKDGVPLMAGLFGGVVKPLLAFLAFGKTKLSAQIGLEISNDDGQTWGIQRLKPLGLIGKTYQRVRWQRNGDGRQRRWRLTLSDPVPRRMTTRAWMETK